MNNLLKHFDEFDVRYNDIEFIDKEFHKDVLGVESFASKAKSKDTSGNLSEEYIRTRFVYAITQSGLFPKENICIEFKIPKGNQGKALKPDVVIFKESDWLNTYNEAVQSKNFSKLRQIYLVFFETKKNNSDIHSAIENQLRPALAENESQERVFGIYFDDKSDILIFKKIANSPLRRYNELLELSNSGLINLNFDSRDNIIDLPSFDDFIENNYSISNVSKLTIDSLDAIDESAFEDFLAELKRAADNVKPKHSERDLIVEFLTLKVFDEKRSKRDKTYLKFYVENNELRSDGLGDTTFRERINNLYRDAKSEYRNVLSAPFFYYSNDLRPSNANEERFLIILIKVLQKRAILKAKNESFNQIIFNNFGDDKQKADKGQFFTPIPVVKAIIEILNPVKSEELCDPCCGICDFPAMAFRHSNKSELNYPPLANNYFGFDIEENNLKLAELNLVLNGDGGAILKPLDSITQKVLVDGSVISKGDFISENYNIDDWSNKNDSSKDPKKFKIIATNPPFGKGRDLKTGKDGKWDVPKETIELYETFLKKSSPDKSGNIKLPNSIDKGVIFLENAYKILEPGGRLGIVLSNSIASISEWKNIRKWFLTKMRLVALFDLPSNSFGETGVSTTVIIAYKPKPNELHLLNNDYEIFIKEIDNIGYEVKTVKRTITFKPTFLINEENYQTTSKIDEDFTSMISEFKEYIVRQEKEIKSAFNY